MAEFDLPLEQLREYLPHVPEPADFDDFWSRTVAEARAVDAAPVVGERAHALRQVETYDLTFPGFGGHPIKAWLSLPADAREPLPTIVQFVGYGGGRGLAFEHTFWASAGFAHIVMDNRGQGSAWGTGGETPDPVGSASAVPGFMTRGILDPHEYYFRRLFTDGVRAVDAARTLPQVDAERVIVMGGSQGGGIALAVAALVPDVLAVVPDVAFLCHFERAIATTDDDPYAEIRRYLAVHRDHAEAAFRTLSYMDGVNFAKRGRAPSLWSVGLMDTLCPPSTTFAAFNHYGGGAPVLKEITVYPFNGHEGGQGHQVQRQWAFLRQLLDDPNTGS